jgi:hypothetical protein
MVRASSLLTIPLLVLCPVPDPRRAQLAVNSTLVAYVPSAGSWYGRLEYLVQRQAVSL